MFRVLVPSVSGSSPPTVARSVSLPLCLRVPGQLGLGYCAGYCMVSCGWTRSRLISSADSVLDHWDMTTIVCTIPNKLKLNFEFRYERGCSCMRGMQWLTYCDRLKMSPCKPQGGKCSCRGEKVTDMRGTYSIYIYNTSSQMCGRSPS